MGAGRQWGGGNAGTFGLITRAVVCEPRLTYLMNHSDNIGKLNDWNGVKSGRCGYCNIKSYQ